MSRRLVSANSTEMSTGGFIVVPSDATVFAQIPRTIYVGGTGDIEVETSDGDLLPFKNFPSGNILPCQVKRILATGTDATHMTALY